jgi:hypothetical protein
MGENWYTYVVADGVNLALPGIYEWKIKGVGSYIGKYTYISRPTKGYSRGVGRLLNNRPYRPLDPYGFRDIHYDLGEAHLEKRQIWLIILENVDPFYLEQRENELIADRGTLNGRRGHRRWTYSDWAKRRGLGE